MQGRPLSRPPLFFRRAGKTWIVRVGERRTVRKIGVYPDMPLADARRKAKAILAAPPDTENRPEPITLKEALVGYFRRLVAHLTDTRTIQGSDITTEVKAANRAADIIEEYLIQPLMRTQHHHGEHEPMD